MNPHLLATLEVIRGGAEAVLELAHGLRAPKVDDEDVVAPRSGELVLRDAGPAGVPGKTQASSQNKTASWRTQLGITLCSGANPSPQK